MSFSELSASTSPSRSASKKPYTLSEPISEAWKPHEYQRRAVKFIVERASAGLLLDPGLGKTSIALAAHKVWRRAKTVDRTLVIAPLRVCYEVWPAEAAKWSDFAGINLTVLHGSEKEARLLSDADVFVINPEGLEWLLRQMGYGWQGTKFKLNPALSKIPPDYFQALIVDESTRFKHSNTMRFRYLKAILNNFRRRVILTGTPAPNGLMDLFGQIYIVDGGRSLGSYITHFLRRWFLPTGFEGREWIPAANAEREIYEAIAPYCLRMSAEDHLDLPDLVTNDVRVILPPAARAVYDKVENEFVADLNAGRVLAINAAVASTKCRQVANGGAYLEGEGRPFTHIHEAKIDAVKDLVEELQGQPALVAYDTLHDLERLQKAFPTAPFIGGGTTPKRVNQAIADYNAGKLPVLLVHPASAAHGLNLQGGRAVIWHSLTWNLEHYEQLIRRVWRQGQKHTVVVHRIIARDTIDDAIVKALARKDKSQNSLLRAIAEHYHA